MIDRSAQPADHGGGGEELVVLLDDVGAAIGSAPKGSVHGPDTPRHLAFSCYVIDPDGRLLVTRRAHDKSTFPGLLTNSVCGHPAPGEGLTAAVRRRARDELGLDLAPGPLRLVLADFCYRAEMDGVVEHEACPVFVALVPRGIPVRAEPREVAEAFWLPWQQFRDDVLAGRLRVSPWCRDQVRALDTLGRAPQRWPSADPARLPPAAALEVGHSA